MIKITVNSLMHGDFPFDSWNFPGGEIGVKFQKKIVPHDSFYITLKGCPNSSDLITLANLCDALQEGNVILYMPYIPYARQDRICHEGESYALKVFVKFLASVNFKILIVDDPHSDRFYELCISHFKDKHVLINTQKSIVGDFINEYDVIVLPDLGALYKFKDQYSFDEKIPTTVSMSKTRSNGRVSHQIPPYELDKLSGKVLVMDDICDGGATFISVAQGLKNKTSYKQLDLFVTHGIFSRGLDELKLFYHNVYCHNLMNDVEGVNII